jgi:histidine ammonia-lyase
MEILLERHDQLDLPQFQRIAFDREAFAVAPALLSRVASRRAELMAHLDSGASAYGVNTGLGYLASRAVEDVDQASFQRSILVARATGVGRPLSEPVVRGAMLLRLTGFLGGYAAVSGELCSLLVDRLNGGWFPVVPGGVSGTAGEIVPLAHLFSALVEDAAYSLGPKEGIALINGAPLAPALGVPLLLRAEGLLEHATLCGALSIALTRASARPYVARVGELKGDPGQLAVHHRLAGLLDGFAGRLADARQAPVSLRVIPQVHGAAADALGHLRGQLDRELRAVTDSPVLLASSGDEPEGLYPTGNFHAQALTLLVDYTAIAMTQVLNLLEKRLHRLLDSRFSGLPDQLTTDPGRQSGLVTLHKQVIGLVAQARGLAAPASVHALDASTGQEDIQAFTLLAAQQLDGVLDALELALAYELVALRQARFLFAEPLPAALEKPVSRVAEFVAPVTEDRSLAADVARVGELVASGELVGRVRSVSIWS